MIWQCSIPVLRINLTIEFIRQIDKFDTFYNLNFINILFCLFSWSILKLAHEIFPEPIWIDLWRYFVTKSMFLHQEQNEPLRASCLKLWYQFFKQTWTYALLLNFLSRYIVQLNLAWKSCLLEAFQLLDAYLVGLNFFDSVLVNFCNSFDFRSTSHKIFGYF